MVVGSLPLIAVGQDQWPATVIADRFSFGSGQRASHLPGELEQQPDLAARVGELEKQLKTVQEKEAESKQKASAVPSLTLSGYLQADWSLVRQSEISMDQFGDIRDSVQFRRARLKASGIAFEVVDYALEVDFATFSGGWNSSTDVTRGFTTFTNYTQQTTFHDTYIGFRELPLIGNLRAGHLKEPFGLEQITSDRFATFMERSMADEGSLVPGRNMGILAFDTWGDEHGAWAAGAFRSDMVNNPTVRQTDNGGTAFTTRVTWLPWYDEASNGRSLFHVGAAYSFRDIDEFGATIAARPEAQTDPRVVVFIMANDSFAANWQEFGAELAWVYGPLSIQSEYFGASINTRNGPNGYLSGGYAYASFFLTGENRAYNRKMGCFDRVKPCENFRIRGPDGICVNGCGAWELGYRFSYLDLNDSDAGIRGGYAVDHTLGLNWYLNPSTRLMWNWVHSMDTPQNYTASGDLRGTGAAYANTGGREGSLDTFEIRAQIDF